MDQWKERNLVDIDPINLADFEALARARVEAPLFDFYAGGSEDEVTLRRNRTAFENILLRPRYLRDVGTRALATRVIGQQISLPVLLAPTGYQKLICQEGELAVARAAASCGTIMVVSTVSGYSLEESARASNGTLWFQLYCYNERRISEWLIRRAEKAGYAALCLTIDVPVLGRRERDLRNRFNLLDLNVRNLSIASEMELPRGLLATEVLPYQAAHFDPRLTWADVAWIRSLTSLPLVIKGILTPEDARLAVEYGAAAIVVSNHGGRQLDGVPATIEVLPEIMAEVGNQVEVLLDGGIRRGTDVLKALALGAKAVLLGRPFLWGLAVNGENGVRQVLEILQTELDMALALVGLCSPREVDSSILYHPWETMSVRKSSQ